MGKKISSLEGLRTIGWIGIFICHFKGAFMSGMHIWTDSTPLRFIYSGNPYVRLFFVISGFVASYKYWVDSQKVNLCYDAVKRYFRLMPSILMAEFVVCICMKCGLLKNAVVAPIVGSENFLGAFNQFEPNIRLCLKEALYQTYLFEGNAYIGPLWTMVYEFLGTLLVIAVLAIMGKSKWRIAFYALFLITYNGYYNYFVVGMIISDLLVNGGIREKLCSKEWICLILFGVGYYMVSMLPLDDSNKLSRVGFSFGLVLFMCGIVSSNLAEKVLGNRLMIEGGRLSYSAYIVHWLIIEILTCGLFLALQEQITSYKILVCILAIITFISIVIMSELLSKVAEPISGMIIRKAGLIEKKLV